MCERERRGKCVRGGNGGEEVCERGEEGEVCERGEEGRCVRGGRRGGV